MPERESVKPEQAVEKSANRQSEERETARTDRQYSASVRNYFERSIQDSAGGDDEIASYFDECRLELEALSDRQIAEKISPTEISISLSELSGNMASAYPGYADNRSEYEEINQENEKRYLAAKNLFMESCARLYPYLEKDASDISVPMAAARRLNAVFPGTVALTAHETETLLRSDPKKLLEKIDDVIFTAHAMKGDAWSAFQLPSGDMKASYQAKLSTAVEQIYKLQLFRDGLQARVYARKDTTPSEATAIDRVRESIASKKTPETEALLTEQEQAALDKLNSAITDEQANEKRSIDRGSVFAREYEPAVAALKSVWNNDGALVRRLNSLIESSGQLEKQKITTGKTSDSVLARNKALEEIFDTLTPREKKALIEASDKESERQKNESSKIKGGLSGSLKTPPQRLLFKLLEALKKE